MATLFYYLISALIRPFLIIQPTRGLSRLAYVLLRTRLGRHHASFIGIAEFWIVCVVLIVWLAALRSLTVGTRLEWFFDIWVSIPVFTCMLLAGIWWGLRRAGFASTKIGPLCDDQAHTNFTGRQARFWSQYGKHNEWGVLTRLEPGLIAAAGIFLLFMPFTRAAGVLLIAVSIASCVHTWRDLLANRQEEEGSPDDVPTVTIPFTAYQDGDSDAPDARGEPRGLQSARFEFDAMGWVALITIALLLNFSVGDFLGLYKRAPQATEAITEGFGRELEVFGFMEKNEDGIYPMTASILMAHNPDRIDEIRASQTEDLSDDVYEAIRIAGEKYKAERQRCEEDLPGQLASPPGDPDLHRLFLNDASTAEDFADILNGLSEAEASVNRWEAELAAIEIKPGDEQAKTRRALREIKRQANGLTETLEQVQAARERLVSKLSE